MMQPRNRNQSRSQQRKGNAADRITPSENLRAKYYDAGKAFKAGGYHKNFAADAWDYLRTVFENPGQAAFALISLIGSFCSIYSVSSLGSSSSSNSGIGEGLSAFVGEASPPIKLIIFVLMVASISWTTSMICILLTLRVDYIRLLVARTLVAFAAILTVFAIQFCFGLADNNDLENQGFFLFAVIGIAIATFLSKTSFRYTREPNPEIIAERAGLLVFFAAATIVTTFWMLWWTK
jgi:hypothetical protein